MTIEFDDDESYGCLMPSLQQTLWIGRIVMSNHVHYTHYKIKLFLDTHPRFNTNQTVFTNYLSPDYASMLTGQIFSLSDFIVLFKITILWLRSVSFHF